MARAVLQAGLDSGRWKNAAPLVPYPDPLGRRQFGGTYEQMAGIATFHKATADLHVAGKAGGRGAQNEGDAAVAPRPREKGPKGLKGGPKEQERQTTL